MNPFPPDRPVLGWILYDESCGFCRSGIHRWEKIFCRHGFAIAPLQADWVRERLGIPTNRLLDDFRLLLVNGNLLSGVAAYRYLMRRVWWAWPIYLISITPGFRTLFDRAYRLIARNRHRISNTCGL